MFITGHRLIAGQQANRFAGSASWLPILSSEQQNWQSAFISATVGTLTESCDTPGFEMWNGMDCSKPGSKTPTQTACKMKNSRKQQENNAVAQYKAGIPNPIVPLDSYDEFALLEKTVFAAKPAPRMPGSPDEELFRLLVKSNLPRHKASPALLERIQNARHIDMNK